MKKTRRRNQEEDDEVNSLKKLKLADTRVCRKKRSATDDLCTQVKKVKISDNRFEDKLKEKTKVKVRRPRRCGGYASGSDTDDGEDNDKANKKVENRSSVPSYIL